MYRAGSYARAHMLGSGGLEAGGDPFSAGCDQNIHHIPIEAHPDSGWM